MKDNYVRQARVVRIIDGDSFEIDIDMGFYTTRREAVRMARYDAKERFTIGGKLATAHLSKLLPIGAEIAVRSYKPNEKYGRFLADVWLGDVHINQQMMDDGFGAPYDGGKKL